MSKDWLYFALFILWAIQTALTVLFMHLHGKVIASADEVIECDKKLIDGLKKSEKVWGDYCYGQGYLDGMSGTEPHYITKEEVIAKAKEMKNASQTLQKAN